MTPSMDLKSIETWQHGNVASWKAGNVAAWKLGSLETWSIPQFGPMRGAACVYCSKGSVMVERKRDRQVTSSAMLQRRRCSKGSVIERRRCSKRSVMHDAPKEALSQCHIVTMPQLSQCRRVSINKNKKRRYGTYQTYQNLKKNIKKTQNSCQTIKIFTCCFVQKWTFSEFDMFLCRSVSIFLNWRRFGH